MEVKAGEACLAGLDVPHTQTLSTVSRQVSYHLPSVVLLRQRTRLAHRQRWPHRG
jgi:hypothetical protein